MNDTKRYILAGLLIFIIILLQPAYLKWLGVGTDTKFNTTLDTQDIISENNTQDLNNTSNNNYKEKYGAMSGNTATPSLPAIFPELNASNEKLITVVSPNYTATISNRSGGSISYYALTMLKNKAYKYRGTYDLSGEYIENMPVSLILSDEYYCQPCLGVYISADSDYLYYNTLFELEKESSFSDTIYINENENITFNYILNDNDNNVLIKKSTTFYGNRFITDHNYSVNKKLFYDDNIELLWTGGIRPSEQIENEDVLYGSAIINQAGDSENIHINKDKAVDRSIYSGQTDWLAIRTKYFLSALVPENTTSFSTLSGYNIKFGSRNITPLYNGSLGFASNNMSMQNISTKIYLGPLDVDYIGQTNSTLDTTMNWGWAIIRPISKGILWVLKFLHYNLHLNYGFSLLVFSLLIRIVTGPLTKKSYESTQKMAKIQPQIKQLQSKYQKDPQKLNKEMIGMYKKYGVNPLGGCLPMLLQMPLLMALFIVFRTTIEFRGQPFIFWITDLSKPDIIFNLPFSLPIYGSGVAILPLIMGITLFLTMHASSATMDKNSKPIMYIMNGFFILLFNTFPSGLNLYYTAYNLMSFLQQRSIRKSLN